MIRGEKNLVCKVSIDASTVKFRLGAPRYRYSRQGDLISP